MSAGRWDYSPESGMVFRSYRDFLECKPDLREAVHLASIASRFDICPEWVQSVEDVEGQVKAGLVSILAEILCPVGGVGALMHPTETLAFQLLDRSCKQLVIDIDRIVRIVLKHVEVGLVYREGTQWLSHRVVAIYDDQVAIVSRRFGETAETKPYLIDGYRFVIAVRRNQHFFQLFELLEETAGA